ncbi:hypothetical protein RSAG8_06113, partial [Rhizoctonia solani AG-8 WAC10335]
MIFDPFLAGLGTASLIYNWNTCCGKSQLTHVAPYTT